MALSAADPIPRLSDACDPPAVIGAAALTTAAFQGATADALAGMIERLDTDPIARLHDTSIAYQLAFRRAEALGLQAEALAGSQLFRIRRESRSPADIRLLALMAPGEQDATERVDAKKKKKKRIARLPAGRRLRRARGCPTPLLVWKGGLAPWSPTGYGSPGKPTTRQRADVMTPRSTVLAIAAGYAPGVHPSAGG